MSGRREENPLTHTDTDQMRAPVPRVDLDAVRARYGEILSAPVGKEFRAAVIRSVVDVPALVHDVDRLVRLLTESRRRYADLVAAGRATLGAVSDGETDPLWYLRDELPERPSGPEVSR